VTSASIEAAATRPPLVRRKPPAHVRRRRLLIGVANHSVLIFFAVLFLAPFMFVLLTSLMTNQQAL
jgi:multiple sugar transport system permease protein